MNPLLSASLRALLTLPLLAVLAFCVFGFLASYEDSVTLRRLPFQIGYGALAGACLFGGVCLWHRQGAR